MLNSNANPEDMLNKGVALYNAGDFAGAEMFLRQVPAASPNHPVALDLMGMVALRTGQIAPALELFEKAINARPHFAEAHFHFASALHAAVALELDGNRSAARHLLEQSFAQHGRLAFPEPDPAFAMPLARLAEMTARINASAAIRLYARSLDQNPDQPDVLLALGWLLIKAGHAKTAVDAFKALLAMEHKTLGAYHGLATALYKSYEFKAALDACSEALRLEPGDMDIQRTQRQIETENHKFKVAMTDIRAALAKDPNNQELQFQLAALSGDKSLKSLPHAQVAATFDKYAANFDSIVGKLNYKGPQIISSAIASAAPNRMFDILDLGCGTGLCGAALKPVARSLAGIDLSPGMIERCRQRNIYDHLEVTDVLTALHARTNAYDLISAADVFEYLGDLDEVFAATTLALRPGGLFAFSVERTDEPGFVLNRTTFRFTHNLDYLLQLAASHGLEKCVADGTPLRNNSGLPVAAWTLLLRKPDTLQAQPAKNP